MKPTILMVDDDADYQMILRAWLEDDYEFRGLSGGDELESALLTTVPDLVVLDLYMPGGSGFELCRRVHARPGLEKVPVIFLTGSGRIEDYRKNLAAGGATYLTKPISRQQLRAAVAELLPQPTLQENGEGD